MTTTLILGDCLKKIANIPDNSIDSIVTDPPYGIKFMSKKWDYQIPSVEVWQECLRVLKPGGHALIACGTRTQHRMAVNIEDAGFEIRDIISWLYGSGFPKSHNIGKAVDKLQGNEREVVGTNAGYRPNQLNHNSWRIKEGRKNGLTTPEFETKGNSQWEGWGTALKPAQEFWTLARKPLSEKTIAQNVLRWGTGGINIDGCRVEYVGKTDPRTFGGSWKTDKMAKDTYEGGYEGTRQKVSIQGRFPANLIHDGSEEVVSGFPDTKSGKKGIRTSDGFNANSYGKGMGIKAGQNNGEYGDSGSASRFFYCAKASKSERTCNGTVECGHPTVKPLKLMSYLCRLITPPKGTVLDPFMGSGSTGISANKEGFDFVGMELNEEYYDIATARIGVTT